MQEDGRPPAKRRRVHAAPELPCAVSAVSGAFQDVPPELLRRILGFLPAHDLCAAGLRAPAAACAPPPRTTCCGGACTRPGVVKIRPHRASRRTGQWADRGALVCWGALPVSAGPSSCKQSGMCARPGLGSLPALHCAYLLSVGKPRPYKARQGPGAPCLHIM